MTMVPELAERRARRGISADPIPDEVIARLLEAATLAPSCFNNQPWRFVAVSGEKLDSVKAALTEGNRWATRAPLIVAFATKPSLDCRNDAGRDYAFFDLGMAAMAFMAQATHEGLVAHPIAGYSPAKAAKAIELEQDFVLVTLVIVGRPSGDQSLLAEWQLARERGPRERKPLGEVAYREVFGRAWT